MDEEEAVCRCLVPKEEHVIEFSWIGAVARREPLLPWVSCLGVFPWEGFPPGRLPLVGRGVSQGTAKGSEGAGWQDVLWARARSALETE